VDEENSLDEALKGKIPPGDEILYERQVDAHTGAVTKTPYLIKRAAVITGEVIADARVRMDGEYGDPYISITFDKRGALLFARVTEANVKRRLAIVLDGNVYSAPVIQEKIEGGKAQITGRFSSEEARDLAIVLRAGSLPAPVNIQEQRTVGPSLGHDTIRMGIFASLIGGMLGVLFMTVYYRFSGLLANFASF